MKERTTGQALPAAVQAVLCSHNEHKAGDLQVLLPGLELRPLRHDQELPAETGDTFLDNARIKARAGARLHPGWWAIADDSGLEVEALDGAPGVHSARFAGPGATDADNNRLLLKRLAPVTGPGRRGARFVCVLVALAPDGRELVAQGLVEGMIADAPRGSNGFGYDPLFIPHGERGTFGELGPDAKQRISHRARAAAGLARLLDHDEQYTA